MADGAARLVDAVLPEVPVRQWVCSLPWSVRLALAYDRELCVEVLGGFAHALERSLSGARRRPWVYPA